MSKIKTHTGTVITKDGEKTVKLHETATTWCVGRTETYRKTDGRRSGATFDKCAGVVIEIGEAEILKAPRKLTIRERLMGRTNP
ncbi:hypothetical protein [Enterobacter kobei]|uniref:hypothetical protein n=1 Tax=Enterobacter kobei TaxID=208224 RepID=UPI002A8410C5|nr:hypothetical protein [Enterobacter kobei]